MRIGVLGTGDVGRAIAGRLAGLGHDVAIGTRDPDATSARETHAAWSAENPGVRTLSFAAAAEGAEVVVNAAGGDVSLDVLAVAEEHLDGVVLLDVSNPLDKDSGFPPTFFVVDEDSLAERIQRRFPAARVVKSLNTMNNRVMADPARLGESHTVFVSGDDPDAKATVTGLLEQMGHDDVLDLGDLTTARGAEMYVALWLRIAIARGGSDFSIKVVGGG